MKIRQDYVSNSSSSSFVLANMYLFDFFDITKKDIMDALVSAYGEDAYKKAKVEILKSIRENPEYHKDDLKWSNYGPLYVYDLADKDDRKEAIARWGRLLKEWDATNCVKVRTSSGKGAVSLDSFQRTHYESAIEGIAEVYEISKWELNKAAITGKTNKQFKRFIRTSNKNPKTGLYGHYETISKEIVDFVHNLRVESGVMTNLDAIKSKDARFFVHADDNCLPYCDPDEYEESHKGKRDTEAYTYDRACELLLDHLVKSGKVNPKDPRYLKDMEVDEKYLTDKDKALGRIYDFANCESLTWEDLKWNSMTWNMHEG